MADLVIKPTSGNLIIKDDQNVARLTIAPTSGATTLSGNTTLAGTANNLGTVTSGTIGSSVVFPSGHIIAHHEFTAQNNNYTNWDGALKTTGNGWSGTTGSQTSKLLAYATGNTMAYAAAGDSLANGQVYLYFHSDATTSGVTPSGSFLDTTTNAGGYTVGLASGRKDLYLSWSLCTTVDVSPNTAYSIQVVLYKHSGNYFNLEARCTGFVQEVK